MWRLHFMWVALSECGSEACTGSTFKELLLHKRLDKAARLLRETRLTIQEVCAEVGYDNTSYFHRVFRRRYGKSPKEYRSELWKTENAT